MKTLIVHVVYGSPDVIRAFVRRLLETETAFSFSGEFVYGNSPFETFIQERCPELAAGLHPCVEKWADNCLNFQYEDSATEFHIDHDKPGQDIKVTAEPLYAPRMEEFLRKAGAEYRSRTAR